MISQTVPEFWELYRALPRKVRQAAVSAYRQFQISPSHPSLRFHRLATAPQFWSVRVTRNYRAVGLVKSDAITWFWIGDHKAFDRAFPR
jgi:hypothetical protein